MKKKTTRTKEIAVEVVGAPSQKLATARSLSLQSPAEQGVAPHNIFHRRGVLSTAQGACWFVFAGAALIQSKKDLKHGEWETWAKENCEFSVRTAQRYMALAEGVKNRALKGAMKESAEEFLQILEKPAGAMTEEDAQSLIAAVSKLTDGETVKELYLDFGITKKPQGSATRGGARNGSKSEEDPNAPEAAAHDFLTLPLREVAKHFDEHWLHLTDADRAEVDGLLLHWRDLLKSSSRKASK